MRISGNPFRSIPETNIGKGIDLGGCGKIKYLKDLAGLITMVTLTEWVY